MKKFLFFWVILIFGFGFGYLENNSVNNDGNNNEDIQECVEDKYKIEGNFDLKLGNPGNYEVTAGDIGFFVPEESNFYVYSGSEELFNYQGTNFAYNFEEAGEYQIFGHFVDEDGCEYEVWETINVYEQIYLYITDQEGTFDYIGTQRFADNNIFLKKVVLPQKTFLVEDDFFQLFSDDISNFIDAERIIINTSNFPTIFDFMGRFGDLYNINFADKDIYLVTGTGFNFLKRTIAQYINKIGITSINVVSQNDLIKLFSDLADTKKVTKDKDYVELFSIDFEDVQKQYFLSYVVDYLVYNEFPINLIGLMLTISVGVLIVSIFRQVIGFSVFGVYNPILFAVSMVVLGIQLTFVLLFISFLSSIIINLFTRRVYLLHSAKISLLMIIYFVIGFFVFWADRFFAFNIVDYSIFTNSFIIFPLIFLIIVANKVFSENFSLFSKGWIVSFIEFIIVSFVVYWVLTWHGFQFFMLSYPDIIFFVLLLNILVGRFTGLQLLEYLRFRPLMKNSGEEE
ncbi:7TM domain-containing protein [Candidatus Absconditicoccus praedator]|uniref:7TM domain-containing protein n=1 Tax=Candidatus Absconditicoccus praedator TaxID=2735562 RepID=UPI001E5A07B6|nr:7TM domain-containing protein [Candidatus Absconditicoccus praedator]UFX82662.1 hypothetical protein HLG78_00730 [Candidatus Absconditicoccus praedator]